MAVLIATSENLAMKVSDEIDSLIQSLDRKDVISQSLENNGLIIIVEKLAEAIKLVNRIAPEHLEVQTADPFEIVGEIRNAGAIFLGAYSPCAIGDYAAGLSHVLPTGGYSKIYSGLSVRDFMKASGIVYCTKDGLRRIANVAVTLANLEGFSSHARSILARESE
jgi:histidinol dehydrogenase